MCIQLLPRDRLGRIKRRLIELGDEPLAGKLQGTLLHQSQRSFPGGRHHGINQVSGRSIDDKILHLFQPLLIGTDDLPSTEVIHRFDWAIADWSKEALPGSLKRRGLTRQLGSRGRALAGADGD